MSRIKSTIFRPILGSSYVVENIKTKETVIGKVPRMQDSLKLGPIRSGKICEKGKEFFKIIIGDKLIKMNNSILNVECMNDDKTWKFTNKRLIKTCSKNTGAVKKQIIKPIIIKKLKKEKPKILKNTDIEFISTSALEKIL